MSVFAIISRGPEPKLSEALEGQYPGKFYRWSDQFAAVSTTDEPKTIAHKLGVRRRTDDGTVVRGIGGVVISKLAPAYYGWAEKNFWEWLKVAHQEDGA